MNDNAMPYEEGERQIGHALQSAIRWGLIDVPKGKQVVITGMHVEGDEITKPGVSMLVEAGPDSFPVIVTGCYWGDGNHIDTLTDIIVSTAQQTIKRERRRWWKP